MSFIIRSTRHIRSKLPWKEVHSNKQIIPGIDAIGAQLEGIILKEHKNTLKGENEKWAINLASAQDI